MYLADNKRVLVRVQAKESEGEQTQEKVEVGTENPLQATTYMSRSQ
jgi:hypothetical protein